MKKFKILSKPTRLKDLNYYEDVDLHDTTELKSERIHNKQLREFRRQTA